MAHYRQRIPLAARLSFIGVGVLVVILGSAGAAQAHNYEISEIPQAGETLSVLPATFEITTNGLLLNVNGDGSGFAIQVRNAAGAYFGDGCVTVSGAALSTGAALGTAGKYTLTWQAISTDGHTVSNSYAFDWQPAAGFTPSASSATAPNCHGTQAISSTYAPVAAPGSSTSNSVSSGTLSAVLWIGGAILAVALAVIATLALTGRRRKSTAGSPPVE